MTLALASALAVTGCLGDPPPDPATAPIEIVVDDCAINRSEVGSGRHSVTVIGEGQVEIADASDEVVLTVVSQDDGLGHLETSTQTYTVTCTSSSGGESSTQFVSAVQ